MKDLITSVNKSLSQSGRWTFFVYYDQRCGWMIFACVSESSTVWIMVGKGCEENVIV